MGLFGVLFGIAKDAAEIVSAPVGVVASAVKEVSGTVAKEVGEVAEGLKNDIRRGF